MERGADLRGAGPDGPWAHLLRTPETARAAWTKPVQDRRGAWAAPRADGGRAGWGGGRERRTPSQPSPAASRITVGEGATAKALRMLGPR